jgi:mono/diheme cytochrome c family protein
MHTWKLIAFATVAITAIALQPNQAGAQPKTPKASKSMIEHGRYLVVLAGCNDCHSPKVMTPMGPMPDTTRLLSGHPANEKLPPYPDSILGMTPDKWLTITSHSLTAWRGPWGTSFTRNLTPDKETGLGSWTQDMFIKAIRTGKDMGKGRDILPPMPWMFYRQMTDQDLKSIFAYLQSLPPISNAVPDPVPPPGAPKK